MMRSQDAQAGTIWISGSDSNYFPLLKDAVQSFIRFPQSKDVPMGILDFGLAQDELDWLRARGAQVVRPTFLMDMPPELQTDRNLSYLARLYLADYFPHYSRYLWFDADAWLQTWDSVDALVSGAETHGLAICHEKEDSYRLQPWLLRWTLKHYALGYGFTNGLRLGLRRNLVNAGIFCMRADAPHWSIWRRALREAIARTGNVTPHDQFALNKIIFIDGVGAKLLPPRFNWICGRGMPVWDGAAGLFTTPHADAEAISVLHLAGADAKTKLFDVPTRAGDQIRCGFRYSQRPDAKPGIASE
ncbi:hypothetical protein [Blastococcus montanus]|uniref:hypothetical protein n=1 Tax=Blastococcus montanus TaxID=3144973 RepID=UPI003209A6E8